MNVPFVLRKAFLRLLPKAAPQGDDLFVIVDKGANSFLKTTTLANLAGGLNSLNSQNILDPDSTQVTPAAAAAGAVVHNLGASGVTTFSLPPAVPGASVKALVLANQALRLDPDGTETVALPSGVQQAAGLYIEADAIGESIHLIVVEEGRWESFGSADGTWTVEGA